MDNKNFAIGLLSTTAVILFVGLAVIHSRPASVHADGMTVRGGDYEITVGALDQEDEELVYVIDSSQQRMIAYRFNSNTERIDIVTGVELANLREQAAPGAKNPGTKTNRRRP